MTQFMALYIEFWDNENLQLTIQSVGAKKINIDKIIDILKKHCIVVDLKRLDETDKMLEASFMIETENFSQLKNVKDELQNINDKVKITLLDNKGLL